MTGSEDEDTWRCDICDQPSDYRKSKFTLEVWNDEGGILLTFCSWGHVAEWVSRGEPDLPKNTGSEPETWVDRAISVGCGLIILVMVGLMIVGAWSLVQALL